MDTQSRHLPHLHRRRRHHFGQQLFQRWDLKLYGLGACRDPKAQPQTFMTEVRSYWIGGANTGAVTSNLIGRGTLAKPVVFDFTQLHRATDNGSG